MNMSIECDVKECKYHHDKEGYCTKNMIRVVRDGTQGQNASNCGSFERGL